MKEIPGQPSEFLGDNWWYVEAIDPKTPQSRRLWALFPLEAWAERWRADMLHPENFRVRQLLWPTQPGDATSTAVRADAGPSSQMMSISVLGEGPSSAGLTPFSPGK